MLKHYFGATRFSIVSPDSGSWRLSRGEGRTDAESYSQKLFAPERMGPRVQIFCELAAPLYQQMAERHAFRHFVYYSPLLPERWRRELEAAAQTYPVLELVPVESDQLDVLERMEGHLARTAGDQQALVFAFRIDDDDLLSADYLDQVEPYLIEAHEGYAVSFASGYAGFFENGGYSLLRRHYQPMSSMGQGRSDAGCPRPSRCGSRRSAITPTPPRCGRPSWTPSAPPASRPVTCSRTPPRSRGT